MPTEPPPPRYRVVERGRRLEVIDQWVQDRERPWPAWPQRPRGGETLRTFAWFDARGPREVPLGTRARARLRRLIYLAIPLGTALLVALITWLPVLLLGMFLIFNETVRARLRSAITGWIDSLEAADGLVRRGETG